MRGTRNITIWLDAAILMLSCLWIITAWVLQLPDPVLPVSIVLGFLIGTAAVMDWVRQVNAKDERTAHFEQAAGFVAYELILLDEMEKPIRAWDLTGRTAMVIGRRSPDTDVDIDVDLSECEYGALVNIQHAILNYCLDSWYIEDPGSQNGIQIKKAEDGKRYHVAPHRPCKISAGDVIYIAKTRLLFT